MLRVGSIVMVLGVVAACTERVNVCNKDEDCTNPAFPFCDVNGEYSESGHEKNSCSIVPVSCPVERCGCEPGTVTCAGDELATCKDDGLDVTKEACALGCASDGKRCQYFEPANGLANQLLASADAPDVTLPDGTTIDTTTGTVKVNGVPMNVASTSIPQTGGVEIRVFAARSWSIGNVMVTGQRPLAFVSVGRIAITGTVEASANFSVTDSNGSVTTGSPCVGGGSLNGGGGGGNFTAGASGAVPVIAGQTRGAAGSAQNFWVPFGGGCKGGAALDSNGNVASPGGFGGGAIQLASLSLVEISGSVSLGGGGGGIGAGGGSGGNLLIEAVDVSITGSIFANGGSGGACSQGGKNGEKSTVAAVGPGPCGSPPIFTRGGLGGTATNAPGSGGESSGGPGGGGGAAGRVRISTKSGTADRGGAVISAGIEELALRPL